MRIKRGIFPALVILLLSAVYLTAKAETVSQRSKAALQRIRQLETAKVSSSFAILYTDPNHVEIELANSRLQAILTDVRREPDGSINWDPETGEGHKLYWSLVRFSRMVNDEIIISKLEPNTLNLLKTVLWDFTRQFDLIDMADTSQGKILRVYESENHDIIRKTVFLMTAQVLKDDPQWQSKTFPDGTTIIQHYNAWVKYFLEYFKDRAVKGIAIEFGATHYVDAYLTPVFTIYECSRSSLLRAQARKFLDLYFADVAQETIKGVRGGAKVRTYKGYDSYFADDDMTTYYNHVLAGVPAELGDKFITSALSPATSSYRLPSVVKELMLNCREKGKYSYISTRLGEGLNDEREKPKDRHYRMTAPSSIYRYSYVTPSYVLGFSTIDETKDYTLLYAQNQWMGFITDAAPDSRVVVQGLPKLAGLGDGERLPSGYYQLQAFGNKQAALFRRQQTDYQKKDKYTHLTVFISDDFIIEQDSGWFFCKNGNSSVYSAFKAVNDAGDAPFTIKESKSYKGKWVQFNVRDEIMILETALTSNYQSFENFKADVADNKIQWLTDGGVSYDACDDAGLLIMYSDSRLPKLNGADVKIFLDKTYESPFIQGDYGSSEVTVTGTDGEKLVLDFDYDEPKK